jgi:hypothetical protein
MRSSDYREEQELYYSKVMERFDGHCVVCFPDADRTGVTVHEIVSRGKNPRGWWLDVDNGCPLCQVHHDYVHTLPSKEREQYCRIHMQKALRVMQKM